MKNLISTKDLSKKEVESIFKTTDKLKGKKTKDLFEKTLLLYFEKPSTRTVVSFAIAMIELGGDYIYLTPREIQISRGETISDTAKVLSRYVNGIVARTYQHQTILDLAKYSTIPVINGLTNLEHPCQALSDLYTIKKKIGLKNKKIVFLGDGANNTFHSLIYLCEKFGFEIIVSSPELYAPRIQANFKIINNPNIAVKNADVIYTDTFVSMGLEKEANQRITDLKKYQLNSKLLNLAKEDCIVMHPLPAHREQEITSDVMDGKNSVIFDQAENRLHVQKAILFLLLR
ncbi:MAG: ornithine carbamoyltransferase [Candidatus Aenigmatarchaeota archaeon]